MTETRGRKRNEKGGLLHIRSHRPRTLKESIELVFNTSPETLAELCGNKITAKQWRNYKSSYRLNRMSMDKQVHLVSFFARVQTELTFNF